jgi:hypothetical protein
MAQQPDCSVVPRTVPLMTSSKVLKHNHLTFELFCHLCGTSFTALPCASQDCKLILRFSDLTPELLIFLWVNISMLLHVSTKFVLIFNHMASNFLFCCYLLGQCLRPEMGYEEDIRIRDAPCGIGRPVTV